MQSIPGAGDAVVKMETAFPCYEKVVEGAGVAMFAARPLEVLTKSWSALKLA